MAIPSLVLTPSEARTRYGTVTPETAGAVEPTGEGWRLLEATENLFLYPNPASVQPGWSRIGQAVVSWVEDGYAPGVHAIHYKAQGTEVSYEGAALYVYSVYPQPGDVYTAQAMMRVPQGLRIRGLIRENSSGAYTSSSVNATGDWQMVTHTHTVQDEGVSSLHFRIDVDPYTAYEMDVALPQIEAKPYATPFTVGTREQGAITVPHPDPVGDLLVRYRENGQERSERLYGPGHFGTSSIARWEDGQLTITTDRELELLGLIAYPAEASVTPFGMAGRGGAVATQGYAEPEGDALVLWEGTTNHVDNPTFADGDGRRTGATNINQTSRTTQDESWHGDWSLRVTGDGSQLSSGIMTYTRSDFTASAGTPITASIWVKVPQGKEIAANIFARTTDGGSHYPGNTYGWTATGDWQRLTMSGVLGHDVEQATPRVQVRLGGEETTFYADASQVELKPYATPFTVGTREDGAITIPLRETPRRIIVAYREGDTDHTATLTGSGRIGAHGWLNVEGDRLTIGTDRSTEILAVTVDGELEDDEATKLLQADVWRWNTVIDNPAGVTVHEVDVGLLLMAHEVEVPITIIPGRVKHG